MALIEYCNLKQLIRNDVTKFNDEINCEVKGIRRNFANNFNLHPPPYKILTKSYIEDGFRKRTKIQAEKGTTTLGFVYNGGVIMAADSRATASNFIGSQSMKKIIEIDKHLLASIAGCVADCTYWNRVLVKQCKLYELRNNRKISIAGTAKLMTNFVHTYRNMGLSMGMMLGGWDKNNPKLYYIDSEGARYSGKHFTVGSGSLNAIGILDTGYSWNLSDPEAYELAKRSVYHATCRDCLTGGIVRVYHISKDGWRHVSDDDCTDLYYKYAEEKAIAIPGTSGTPKRGVF